MREVRDSALRVEQNSQRIETARLGRELAEQRLDAEQKRFEVGMSTSFLVIQAQRDLAVALDNELRAYLDYQLAVVNFERVQQVGQSDRVQAGTSQPASSNRLGGVEQAGQILRTTQVGQ